LKQKVRDAEEAVMSVVAKTYEEIALEDRDHRWELHRGQLREKPPMSVAHNWSMRKLGWKLKEQLPESEYAVIVDTGRVRRTQENYYIPDVMVVPIAAVRRLFERPHQLEVYDEPLPFVGEFWSPSTGNYDVGEKLDEYMNRGDREIWRAHQFERTVTAWHRQPDGSYTKTVYHGGVVGLVALPNVTIDLDDLFAPA
jgi:Uma2 family endonuclease